MLCLHELAAPLASTSPPSPTGKASSSKTGSTSVASSSSKRSSLLDRTTQVPDDAHSIPFRPSKSGSGGASRSSRSLGGSVPAESSGSLGQWVPRPPDTQRSLGLAQPRRFQPSPPPHPPQVPQPVQALHSRSGLLRDELSLSARLRSPRDQLTVQSFIRKGTSSSSTARSDSADQGNTCMSLRPGGRSGSRREESTASTFHHLAAELIDPPVDAAAAGDSACHSDRDGTRCRSRHDAPQLDSSQIHPRSLVIDVQLEWPPRTFSGAQREKLSGTSTSSCASGATLPLPPEQDDPEVDTPHSSEDLEQMLQGIQKFSEKVEEPSTQELLAGAVRITPLSQQSHRQLSFPAHGIKSIGSETPNTLRREAAAIGIQAAIRGAQRRAAIARSAAEEIQSLKSTVDNYERCVLPQIVVGNAVGQGLLRSQVADLSAQKDLLVEKLAERDQELAQARKNAAAAEADCATLRSIIASDQALGIRAAVDRRLGGA